MVASTDGVVDRRFGADKPGLHVSGDTGRDRFVEHDPDFDDRILAGAKTRNVEGTLNQLVVSSWVENRPCEGIDLRVGGADFNGARVGCVNECSDDTVVNVEPEVTP